MGQRHYDVLYAGELVEGADGEAVKARLAALFKTDVAGIARLFSGETLVIKRALDEETAQRYREAMRHAGALCRLRVAADTPPAAPPEGSLASATVLPAGSLLPQPPKITPLEFNLEGLTIAPPGVQLVEWPAPIPAPLPDVSGITLAPPGERLVEAKPIAPVALPDVSRIDLAPPGSDLVSPGELPSPPAPPSAGSFELV